MSGKNSIKGRGTANRVDARYLDNTREAIDDGWGYGQETSKIKTTVTTEKPKTILAHNQSPDVPFTTSINPYRGCEHGCIYCYARPSHAYLDLSPGIDFESRLFAKPDAAELLKHEIGKSSYECTPIALGSNTDPYQPIEREWKITRSIIETLHACDHPLTIVTKSWLVERDMDLLAEMADKKLVQVFVSITTLDHELARWMEPRATSPARRLQTLRTLHDAGIPTGVMFAPVIPVLNDTEMEAILEQAAAVGILNAGYVMLRLPHEVKLLFKEWLETHYPLKAGHVMSLIKDIRGGLENDPQFGSRMSGQGVFAGMIKNRFAKQCRSLGLNQENLALDTTIFRKPVKQKQQMDMFA